VAVEQVVHQVEEHQVVRTEKARQVIQGVKAVTQDPTLTQDQAVEPVVPLWY
jgi:hypothetical protein